MDWRQYLIAIVLFNAIGLAALMALLMCQGWLPFNPQHFSNPVMGFSVEYRGQFRQQHQLAGLRRGNHHELSQPDGGPGGAKTSLSAATGIAVIFVLTRARARQKVSTLGNAPGRPDPHYAVAATANLSADCAVLCATGRAAEPAGLSAVHQPGRRSPMATDGTGRLAGSDQKCSVPTAAGSLTPTHRIRLRTRRR